MDLLVVILGVIYFNKVSAKIFHWNNNACKNYIDYPTRFINNNCFNNPDIGASIPTIVARHNYILEAYKITTNDHYILTIFRIPSKKPGAQPVYLQHGLSEDATVFLLAGRKSLVFVLANLGYDVWFGNFRGTPYSPQHFNLTVEDPNYWNFNLDTLVTIDLRVLLHYVAKKTGQAGSIIYIGHSMGGTLAFMLASDYAREANGLLRGIVTLAPVVYTENFHLLDSIKPITHLLDVFNFRGLFYHTGIIRKFFTIVCTLIPFICRDTIATSFGPVGPETAEYLLLFFNSIPVGTALNEILQYIQIHDSNRFEHFDYGKSGNLKTYGTEIAPLYDLGKITLPVYVLYGKHDNFCSKTNMDRLIEEVGSNKKIIMDIPSSNSSFSFNHFDFIFSKHLEKTLYSQMIPILVNDLAPL